MRQGDGQDAVLETIVIENIGIAGGDHTGDAKIRDRPGRVFARRSAAKVVARHKNLRLAVLRFVQHEIGNFVAIVVIAHLVKKVHAKARPLDGFQELLGDDHIGVDVDQRHGGRDPGEFVEFVHVNELLNSGHQILWCLKNS